MGTSGDKRPQQRGHIQTLAQGSSKPDYTRFHGATTYGSGVSWTRARAGCALAWVLLVAPGCGAPSAPEPDAAPRPAPAEAPAPVPLPPSDDPVEPPRPLGFDAVALRPAPPVRWTDRFEVTARLLPGSSPYADLSYRWYVNGEHVRGWRREFLRQSEGDWRKGDTVEVEAVAEDETGRVARSERLAVLVGEEAPPRERTPPPPPVDWDALRAERAPAPSPPPERTEEPEDGYLIDDLGDPWEDPGAWGYYVNPRFGPPVVIDPGVVQPRRGITTGPQQRVDGYSPGEPRVDGWSPGEPRVGRSR